MATLMNSKLWVCVIATITITIQSVIAAPEGDLIKSLPGWDGPLPSKQYSGFINVTSGGQHIMCHYNFVTKQPAQDVQEATNMESSSDPLILWQQGGPGSSGFGYGYMTEMGPFHLSAESLQGNPSVPKLQANPYSWDHLGNLLILEHPPGTGYSYCHDGNGTLVDCIWNDDTQAEAFHAEIGEWFKMFPEYSNDKFYLTGESYAGLLVPNLMNKMVQHDESYNLQAVALGNACTGTPGQSPANPGQCNLGGSFDLQHNMDLFFGHGMVPAKLYKQLYKECPFSCGPEIKTCRLPDPTLASCQSIVNKISDIVGAYNIYNIYDTCGGGNMSSSSSSSSSSSQSTFTSFKTLRDHQSVLTQHDEELREGVSGGPPFSYPCGTGAAVNAWMNSPIVRTAINMPQQSFYGKTWPFQGMKYQGYTHASIDLWPDLVTKFRTVIYNGDVDACVPYNGNEDWTAGLGLVEAEAWRPWVIDNVPAGYVTTYETAGPNFTFITIKDAGHLVPGYQPLRAWNFLQRFLQNSY